MENRKTARSYSNFNCIASALAIACALCGSGCRRSPAKAEYRIGDQVTAGPLTYNVVETRWQSQLDAFPSARIPDREFLLVRIVVTNGGGSDVSIPLLKVENRAGASFTESNNGAGVENWMGLLRRVGPAQTAEGWLLFDVPPNSYLLRVTDTATEHEHPAYVDIPMTLAQ